MLMLRQVLSGSLLPLLAIATQLYVFGLKTFWQEKQSNMPVTHS
jgi:hypothetical protein